MSVQINMIGGFGLKVDGRPREMPVRKAQLVLARLALSAQGQASRQDLRQMFWERSDEAQAQVSLRQALARIRKGLGPSAGLLAGDLDTIRLEDGIETDVARLDAAADGSVDRFDETLVSGELLAGLAPREPAAENWLAAERSRTRQRQTAYCRLVAERALASAAFEEALQAALKGLLLDNLDETLHRAAMRAHGGLGNRTSALAQFRQCEAVLSDELGIAPDPQTRALADAIRAGTRGGLGGRGAGAAGLQKARGPPDMPDPGPSQTEIRQASVLCVARQGGDDPEDYVASASALAGSLAALAAEHGAELVAGEADEVFLLFGTRAAHQADPVRAEALAAALVAGDPAPRVGLATGRVVVTRAEDGRIRFSGEPRARAMALMGTARPGQVRKDTAPALARPEPVFVGRAPERDCLRSLLGRCRAGDAALAVIQGEPGIGKTRLSQAFAADARAAGADVLRIGFEAFGRRLGAAETLIRAAVDAGGELPETASLTQTALFAEITGLDPPPGGASLVAAMTRDKRRDLALDLVQSLLQTLPARPAVIIAEDTHWASPADIGFLVALTDRLVQARAMIVATERRAGALLGPALAGRSGALSAMTLTLAPFSLRDGMDLAQALGLGDTAFVETALERSKGNPLFLSCLLVTGPNPAGRLPATVVALVQEQMDGLAARPNARLRQAAILGQSFRPEHFVEIFGPADWGDLIEAGFLRRDGPRLAFAHALVHEAVYGSITRADRKHDHARAAGYFSDVDPVLWADHALAAGLPEAARACSDAGAHLLSVHDLDRGLGYIGAGLEQAENVEDRATLLIARGTIDRERGNLASALADYDAASTAGAPPWVQMQALVRRAWVLRLQGELDLADAALDAAGALDLDLLRPDWLSEYENQRGAQAFVRGDYTSCARHNRRAMALATTPLHKAQALGGLGDALYSEGRMFSAYNTFVECNALAREHALGVVELSHLNMEGDSLHFATPGQAAWDMLFNSLDRAREAGNARSEILALLSLAEMAMEDAQYGYATEIHRDCQSVIDRIGAERFMNWQILYETVITTELASPGAAEARMSDWLETAGRRHPDWIRCDHHAALAAARQAPDRVLAALADGAALIARGEPRYTQFWYHRLGIDALLRIGRADLARKSVADLRRITEAEPLVWTDLVLRRGELLIRAAEGQAGPQDRVAAAALRADLIAHRQAALVPGLDAAFGA